MLETFSHHLFIKFNLSLLRISIQSLYQIETHTHHLQQQCHPSRYHRYLLSLDVWILIHISSQERVAPAQVLAFITTALPCLSPKAERIWLLTPLSLGDIWAAWVWWLPASGSLSRRRRGTEGEFQSPSCPSTAAIAPAVTPPRCCSGRTEVLSTPSAGGCQEGGSLGVLQGARQGWLEDTRLALCSVPSGSRGFLRSLGKLSRVKAAVGQDRRSAAATAKTGTF